MAATKRKRKKKINPIRIFVVAVMAVLIVFCGYSVKISSTFMLSRTSSGRRMPSLLKKKRI